MKDILDYIADMAQQLADMCRGFAPQLAIVLELASEIARDKIN